MRKLRAAGRLVLFHYVLRAKRHTPATDLVSSLAGLVWSLATDTGNKGNTGKGNTTARPLHSTLPQALALAYEQKQTWQRSRIVVCGKLHVSTSRTPPHCEGHPPSQWTSQRWEWAIPMQPLPKGGIRVAMALPRDAISLPRDGYCLLSLTLPRTRISGECNCMVEWNSKEAHPEDEGGVQ